MKKNPLIAILATIGLLAILWMIFPKWLVVIVAFFSVLIAMNFNDQLNSYRQSLPPVVIIPEPNRRPNHQWLPESLFIQLSELTINQGIEFGIITDLGNDEGQFCFYDSELRCNYALVNGYKVYTSQKVADIMGEDDSLLGNLFFFFDGGGYTLMLPKIEIISISLVNGLWKLDSNKFVPEEWWEQSKSLLVDRNTVALLDEVAGKNTELRFYVTSNFIEDYTLLLSQVEQPEQGEDSQQYLEDFGVHYSADELDGSPSNHSIWLPVLFGQLFEEGFPDTMYWKLISQK